MQTITFSKITGIDRNPENSVPNWGGLGPHLFFKVSRPGDNEVTFVVFKKAATTESDLLVGYQYLFNNNTGNNFRFLYRIKQCGCWWSYIKVNKLNTYKKQIGLLNTYNTNFES